MSVGVMGAGLSSDGTGRWIRASPKSRIFTRPSLVI
jgi:hypothetical protein